MQNGFLDNYVLPDGAREDLDRAGFKMRQLEAGVSIMDGHDRGVAFRFFRITEPNTQKTKLAGSRVLLHDTEDCIEWNKSKRSKPVERVRFLPEGLLKVEKDDDGELIITGHPTYVEAYKRYKKGLKEPGLSLTRWGYLDDASVATLVSEGVFSVEQFASLPRSKVDRFPLDIREAFEHAIFYVNGQKGRFEAEEQGKKILSLQAEISKRDDALAAMQEQINELMSYSKKAKSSKKKKESKEVIEESETNE